MLSARGAESALRKAKRYGKSEEFDAKAEAGNPIYFEFIGVTDLLELGAECEPNEVWYDIVTLKLPSERRDRLIPKESDLNAIGWERKRKNMPNKPAAPNAGIASRLAVEHHRPGVGEPERCRFHTLMRMSHVIGLVVVSAFLLQSASGQGFVNLNFEATQLSAGGSPSTVSASSAFPGWNVFIGTNAQSSVLYNNATLGASSVALLAGGSYSPVSVFDGSFSALLVTGVGGNASLSQTGAVPASANSILLCVNMGHKA